MTTDTLSKQCVIIGSFSTALSLVLILLESQELLANLQSEYTEENSSAYVSATTIQLVEYAVGTIFSILLIVGVIKRRLGLMVPWMITAFAGVTFVIYVGSSILMMLPFGHLEFLLPSMAFIGMVTVILYPLCSLFRVIWLEKSVERQQKVQDQINYNKKASSGFVDLGFKVIV